jgi:hypothetical protein
VTRHRANPHGVTHRPSPPTSTTRGRTASTIPRRPGHRPRSSRSISRVKCALVLVILVACSGRDRPLAPAPVITLDATPEAAEAAYDAKNWAECASLWTAVGQRATGEQKTGALYDAACCYALDGRPDAAVASLETALAAGYWDVEHMRSDTDLEAVRMHPKWPALEARAAASFAAFEKTLVDPALRRELLALAAKDIAARNKMTGPDDKVGMEAVAVVDRETTARMKQVVAQHGWPGKRIVGVDGANAAWLLVHHADADVAFQKTCLALMEPLVAAGEVTGKDYAFLWDRVAIAEGRKQRYGTQLDGDDVAPLEDPANVDARRKQMGMETLAEYKAFVKQAESK